MIRLISIGLFLFIMGGISLSTAQGLAADNTGGISKIFVSEFSQVEGDQILLGQISRIEAIPFVREVLEQISLGRSPKPGRIKSLDGDRLAARIRSGRDLPGAIEVITPDKVYVKQAFLEMSEDEISSRVVQQLDRQFSGREYEIKTLWCQSPKRYPKGQLELNLPGVLKIDRNGRMNFAVEVVVDDRRVDTLRVRGEVAVFETVICAANNLKKGQPVGPGDVIGVKKDIFSLRHSAVRQMDALEGNLLTSDVKKGEPIRASWLAPMPLVRKGEVVSLVVRADALKIETSGIALEDGFKDRPVRVENLTSGRLIRGIVRAASTVEVVF